MEVMSGGVFFSVPGVRRCGIGAKCVCLIIIKKAILRMA